MLKQAKFLNFKILTFLVVFLLAPVFFANASNTDGTVSSSSNNLAKVLSSGAFINFGLSQGNIHVLDTGLTGYAWGESMGWINMNPSGGGVTSDAGGTGNAISGTAHLSGYAWGQLAGWINFAPTNGGVTIDSNGDFHGYAWSQNFGWIVFNCDTDSSCGTTDFKVSSDWRPTGVRPQCNNTNDDDNDGSTDFPVDSGCQDLNDDMEYSSNPPPPPPPPTSFVCSDGIDNDNDGLTDYSNDPGCAGDPQGTSELPFNLRECNDGEDNDNDGSVDLADSGCSSLSDNSEDNTVTTTTGTTTGTTGGTTTGTGTGTTGGGGGGVVGTTGAGTGTGTTGTGTTSGTTTGTGVGTGTGTGTTGGSGSGSGGGTGGGSGTGGTGRGVGDFFSSVTESLNLQDSISDIKTKVFVPFVAEATRILETPEGEATAKTVTAVGLIGGGISFLPTMLVRLWGLVLTLFGFRKKYRPWGVVYDSVTKQPLDPAYVVLLDSFGNEVSTSITDLDGRYGFLLQQGRYRIIVNKTNYLFPSKKLFGKTNDDFYDNLYFGEEIVVDEKDSEVAIKNIPLDPINFDFNEFAKRKSGKMSFFTKHSVLMRRLSQFMFDLGLAIATIAFFIAPEPYNLIIFALYIILLVMKIVGLKPKAHGRLIDKLTGYPLPFAVVRVYSVALGRELFKKVADQNGKYYILVPPGDYAVEIERKNSDETYTSVFRSPIFEVKKGVINKNFEI